MGFLFSPSVFAQSDLRTNGPILFDIPAQPLDQALDAFGAVSGLQIFYENASTSGRRSTAVHGTFDRQVALRILLQGSGLAARVIATGTISVAKLGDADAAPANGSAEAAYLPYYGRLQADVMKMLCGKTETRPGKYHIALQYWIDARGRIASLTLIGSSGNHERDSAIMAAVKALSLPPPGDMPQPVTMAIEPVQPDGCPSADAEETRGR
jgi:TonB family protein